MELGTVEAGCSALSLQLEEELQITLATLTGLGKAHELVTVDKVHAGAPVRHKVVFIPISELGAFNGQTLPFSLEPIGENASGRLLLLWFNEVLKLLQVEGLEPVLGRVQVPVASQITAEGHVGEASVGIFFEQLQNNKTIN